MKLTSLILALLLLFPASGQADAGREFLMSCTYGVLTGALVGAATLAVEDDPDQKLHRIARGASLGLYTGILLGLYVVYMVPAQMSKQGPSPENYPDIDIEGDDVDRDPETYDYDDGYEYQEIEDYGRLLPQPKMIVYPVFEQNKMTGAAIRLSVYSF